MSVTVRILEPEDRQAFEAFVAPRIHASALLAFNVRHAGLVDRGRPYEATYAAAWDGGDIIAVVAHCWNGMLVVQAPVHGGEVARAAVDASRRAVTGAVGPAEQVDLVVRTLALPEGDAPPVQLDDDEGLYVVRLRDLAMPDALREGRVGVRRATMSDLELVTRWRSAFAAETLHADPLQTDAARAREHMRVAIDEGDTWLAETDEGPCAMSRVTGQIAEAAQVGWVYTPPQQRGRRRARCAVAGSLRDVRAEGGETAVLFASDADPAARKCYESLGFVRIADHRLLLLRTGGHPAARGDGERTDA